LPKTLIDGGSSLNIIFTETLRKMVFDFTKMTACDEPFYGVVPGKAAYPIGRVCLPVTFGTEKNFRTEYLLTVYFGAPSMFITLWFGFDYGTNPPLGTLII
jgi:hypothetical protein